jgi:hypothetical protein
LVDAVMDLSEVQDRSRMEATVPLGDAESLERLRDRTDETVTRPAGSTALVDGDIQPASHPAPARSPEARHLRREIAPVLKGSDGRKDRDVRMELRSLAP